MTNQTSSIDSINIQLPEFVADARFHGASWAAIGDALGMSRQAAHERFGGDRADQQPSKVVATLRQELDDERAMRAWRLEQEGHRQ